MNNRFAAISFLLVLLITPLIFLVNQIKNPFLIQSTVLNVGLVIIAVGLLLKASLQGAALRPTSLDRFWLSLIIVSFISLVAAILKNPVGRTAIIIMGMDNLLFLMANCWGVFYLAFTLSRSPGFTRQATWIMLSVGGLASLYGLLQYFGIEPFWPHEVAYFQGRIVSTFGNPNFLGSFLVLLIPVAIVQFLLTSEKKVRLVLGVLLLLTFTALMASSARSGWLGLIVAMGVLLIYLFKLGLKTQVRNILKIIGIVILAGTLVVLLSNKKELLLKRATLNPLGTGTSVNQRFLIWCCAAEMLVKNPVLGQGWGLFELYYPYYQARYLKNPHIAPYKTHANHAHNEVLQVGAELGAIGLLLGIYFFMVFFRQTKAAFSSTLPFTSKIYMAGLSAGLIGMMADCFFNVSLHITSTALFFWLNMGLLFGLGGQFGASVELNPRRGKWLAVVGVPIVVLFALFQVLRLCSAFSFFAGTRIIAASDRLPGQQYQQKRQLLEKGIGKLETTLTIFPWDHETAYELGGGYFRKADYNQAALAYSRAAELNFSYEEIFYMLGMSELQLGNFPGAAAALTKAYTLNPNNQSVLNGWQMFRDAYQRQQKKY